jgi:hypothetical protein
MRAIKMLKQMHGKGLSPMSIAGMRRVLGGGLLSPAGGRMRKCHMGGAEFQHHHKYLLDKLLLEDPKVNESYKNKIRKEHGFLPLIGPASVAGYPVQHIEKQLYGRGMKRHVRKGHYRYVHKRGMGVKRVHVRAHRVGGYAPYTF